MFENRLHEVAVLFLSLEDPAVLRGLIEVAHPREVEAVIGHGEIGEGMAPVLEHAVVHGLELVEHIGVVVEAAGPEDMVVSAPDNGEGVDLDVTEMLYGAGDAFLTSGEGGLFAEELGLEGQTAGGCDG
jgi:hypothetical protein